jgi:HEAT repeat protein
MTELPDRTRSVLKELQPRSAAGGVPGSHQGILIPKLEALADAALELSAAFLESAPDVRSLIVVPLLQILLHVRPSELPGFDERIRRRSWEYPGWHKLRPLDLNHFVEPRFGAVLAIASMHPNGYVRQAALEFLRSPDFSLPFLLVRLTDWVPAVRDEARERIQDLAKPQHVRQIAQAFGLIQRLRGTARGSQERVVTLLERLVIEASEPIVDELLGGDDRIVRRSVYRLLLQAGRGRALEAVTRGVLDPDPALRSQLLDVAEDVCAPAEVIELYTRALKDPVGRIRRKALDVVVSASAIGNERLTAFIFDANGSVRETARSHLLARGIDGFREAYIGRLQKTGPRIDSALAGLAEVGSASDMEIAFVWLDDPRARVRRAAIRVLDKLGNDDVVGTLLQMLGDKSPSVSGAALRALSPRSRRINPDLLRAALALDQPSHVQRHGAVLMNRLPKWDSIHCALINIGHPNAAVATLAMRGIRQWIARFNRSFVAPDSARVTELRGLLESLRFRLDSRTIRELSFYIG